MPVATIVHRLPVGVVETPELLRVTAMLGWKLHAAALSELIRQGAIAPEPYRLSVGAGRPSRTWNLERTLEALEAHYAS